MRGAVGLGLSWLVLVATGCGAGSVEQPPPAAGLVAGMDFSRCPWPSESLPDTRAAVVRMKVLVGPDGSARGVEIDSATPEKQGFGERAQQCALAMKFEPGVMANGEPTQAWTPIFQVDFAR